MAVTEKIFLPIGDPGGPTSGQTQFTFEFPYVTQADVKVSLDGTDTTEYTFANATTIQFNTAPDDGDVVRIYRITDNDDVRAEFYPGSAIRAQDLNNNFEQILYVTQENTRDQTNLKTYVDTTFVEDTRVHFTGDTWSDADDYNIPTVRAVSDRLVNRRDAGLWDTRYYTKSELNAGQLDTRYYTETELLNGALDSRYYTETESLTKFVQTTGSLAVYVAPASFGWSGTDQFVPTQALVTNYINGRIEISTDPFTTSNVALASPGYIDSYYYPKSQTYTKTEADARFWNVNSTEYISSVDTWTPDDQHIATTAAIEARIVTLVDDVGGFVPVASYTSFPTTNPDPSNNAGTVVSIQNVSGLTHSTGTSTNATTTGAVAVTITGIPTGLPSPVPDDYGMLVVTTSTLNSYTFHRLVAPASDVVDVANNATNITTVAGQITPFNNVGTVAAISSQVATVAGNVFDVVAVAGNASNINTVAGISGDVTTVAGIGTNVTTVAGNTANVTAVANNAANINTVSASITNVNNVGGSIANVNTVATNVADVNTVAADITDVTAVSTNIGAIAAVGSDLANSFSNIDDYGGITDPVTSTPAGTSDIQTVATNIANVNTVAGISGNVTTVAGISANVTTVAGNTANINAVAADATDIGTVAGSITNVNTVGTNITSVNTAATNIAAIIAAPTEAANAASSASAAATSESNAATSESNAATSESNAATSATAAATSESNAATSASNASTSATNAAASATAAASSAAAALVSETNADNSADLALQYRDDTAGLLTQADSDPYNVNTNQSWGDIIASAFSYFANEVLADTLLTMSKGTNTYDYGIL